MLNDTYFFSFSFKIDIIFYSFDKWNLSI